MRCASGMSRSAAVQTSSGASCSASSVGAAYRWARTCALALTRAVSDPPGASPCRSSRAMTCTPGRSRRRLCDRFCTGTPARDNASTTAWACESVRYSTATSEKDSVPGATARESMRPESSDRCDRPPTSSSTVRTTKSASSATIAAK